MANILAIEDQADLLSDYELILSNDGHTVRGFTNGEEGLDCFESENFDLIITDLQLPGISGKHLLKSIQSCARNSNCPILVSSGNLTEVHSADQPMSIGRLHFLSKPFNTETLKTKVKQALNSKSSQQVSVGSNFLTEVAASAQHCLSTMLHVPVTFAKPREKNKLEPNGDISSVTHAVSTDFTGTIAVSMANESFRKIVARLINVDPSTVDYEMRDAVAEFLNTIFSDLKQKLNSSGADFRMDIPSIVIGKDHCIEFRSAYASSVIAFNCEGLGILNIIVSAIR